MKRISATFRIAISLAALSVSLLLGAHMLGMLPSEHGAIMKGRSTLCESLAINFSLLVDRGAYAKMEEGLEVIQQRNPEVVSIAVRRSDGEFLAKAGDHAAHWKAPPLGRSTETNVYVPIMAGSERWGTVEICFQPIRAAGPFACLQQPVIRIGMFMMVAGTAAYYFFLRRVLRQLNPSKVVPGRVRAALDTLAEGLLVLDTSGRIVLANKAFGETVRRPPEELLGSEASELPWSLAGEEQAEEGTSPPPHPWSQVLGDGNPRTGEILGLNVGGPKDATFVVNATPIRDGQGASRGVLASFEDVTDLEEKRVELSNTLDELSQSSEEIQRQNEELERLATRDSLTACFNRRAFFEQFETHWSNSRRYDFPLSCVMIDIDHFKSVNDTFGHQTGDNVLKKVAEAMQTTARDGDIVCRYGGEEFAVLLPHTAIEDADQAAERFRAAVEAIQFPNMTVTASLGVSALNAEAHDPQALLEQADKCLYVAKRNGRNQVVRWDDVPENVAEEATEGQTRTEDVQPGDLDTIPFQAVTGLFSALAYRDLETAEHSRRVADLCVATAEGLTTLRDCYLLEIAALLHDIGKVGVPDSILLKPGALTDDEWQVMRRHDRVGVEIIEASFGTAKLTSVVASHSAHYGGTDHNSSLPVGADIPLGSRILSIADAYDSMVSDRVYRKGRSPEEAFAELRRCAGSQFDPELVESFILTVKERCDLHQSSVGSVSKKAATSIGRQISRLISALDNRDTAGLQVLAGRLKASAEKHGVPQVADKASTLEESLDSNGDAIGVLKAANELVDLCRATQRAYLQEIDDGGALERAAAVTAQAVSAG